MTAINVVEFPKLKKLGVSAFEGCVDLITVSLPSLGKVPSRAFTGCINLVIVVLNSAEKIDVTAFENRSMITIFKAHKEVKQ